MRALILAAGAALTLTACGGNNEAGEDANNTMQVENLEVGNVILNDTDMMNGTDVNGMNTMDANMMATDNTLGTDNTTTTTNNTM